MHRFEGIKRIYGTSAERLFQARVLIVGLGGVGSWAAEALARSGVGGLTLIDPDEVCVTNVNRQVQALDGSVGRIKVDVLAERIRSIHPTCRVETQHLFFHQSNAEQVLATRYDYVIDAIDGVMAKAHLIARCHELGYPVITCGGAAGKRDPLKVGVVDLSETYNDRLLVFVRRKLRRIFGFPGKGAFGVPCVFSAELATGCDADPEDEPKTLLDEAGSATACEGRLGAAVFVTGVFGFYAAAHVVNALTGDPRPPPSL